MKAFFCGLICSLSTVFLHADIETLNKNLQQKHPKLQLKHIQTTPISGLYSANLDGRIIYLSEDAEYVLAGGVMIRLKDQHNLTQDLVLEQNHIDWESLPLKDAIKTVQGNGSRKLAVFSDPNCPYCKRLEAELAQLNDVTIYTFMLPLKPQSLQPSQAIWCAQDRSSAWKNYILNNMAAKTARCANPIQRNLALAKKFAFQGTPVLVFSNGFVSAGFHRQQDIVQLWQDLNIEP